MIELIPVAEHFHSIQGEGEWVGTPMHFIRLSGCPVGAKATRAFLGPDDIEGKRHDFPVLKTGQIGSKCQAYDGRFFDCDTDFYPNQKLNLDSLLADTYERHICLTGGEPLAHQQRGWFTDLFNKARDRNILIHIETSGTIQINESLMYLNKVWLTVSPKLGYLRNMIKIADEIKLLVDKDFDLSKINLFPYRGQIFLSPINGETTVNQENVQRCMTLLKEYPDWKLSCQWHKFIGVR